MWSTRPSKPFWRATRPGLSRGLAAAVLALAAVTTAGAAVADARPGATRPKAAPERMAETLCAALMARPGAAGLVARLEPTGWTLADALETADCRYLFISGGAPSPAGHLVVARYRNHPLIPWLAAYYRARGDAAGIRRLFARRSAEGDARDWLEAQIRRFRLDDPAIAKLYIDARLQLDIALNRARRSP